MEAPAETQPNDGQFKVMSASMARAASLEVLECALATPGLATAPEEPTDQEIRELAEPCAGLAIPFAAPDEASVVLHDVEEILNFGDSSNKTTLAWLWDVAAALASGSGGTPEKPLPPTPSLQRDISRHLPHMLGPSGRFGSFKNAQGYRIACYFWPATGCLGSKRSLNHSQGVDGQVQQRETESKQQARKIDEFLPSSTSSVTPSILSENETNMKSKGVVVLIHGHGSYTGFEWLNIPEPGAPPEYEGSWVQDLNNHGFSASVF